MGDEATGGNIQTDNSTNSKLKSFILIDSMLRISQNFMKYFRIQNDFFLNIVNKLIILKASANKKNIRKI